MDACLGVEREVVKVLDKFTNLRDQNVGCIDDLLSIVRNAKAELQNGKFSKAYVIDRIFICVIMRPCILVSMVIF